MKSQRYPHEGQHHWPRSPTWQQPSFLWKEGQQLAWFWEPRLVPGLLRVGELLAVTPTNTEPPPPNTHPNPSPGAADPNTHQARVRGGAERPQHPR